uniref:Testicular haploid expressed gene protein-like isoform X3 n=1 Tax=Phascolarctos cinereus TaxID=38626 RepID=A0A6P5J9M7_PHACI|nr:testicular haploid expressed gene protein-like isoform X3 [Phascolarctos cinereus]
MEYACQVERFWASYKARPASSVFYSTAKTETRGPLRDLSRPKKAWRAPDRKLVWGNQDTIRPLSFNALNAKLTKRVERLAEPKKLSKLHIPNRPEYHNSWGRGSIIWELPTKSFFSYPSPRIESLAEPKQLQEEYLQKRPYSSPEWHVKDPSVTPEASVRIVQLSVAKSTHPDFVAPKQVSTAAMTAQPSPRTLFLAKAKSVHSDYLPVRPVQQPVSRAALKYVPSPRIEVLSTPSARTPLTVNAINLDAFKVKDAAKVAVCSPRIVKLAEPIKR